MRNRIATFFVGAVLLLSSSVGMAQDDPRLDILFKELKATSDARKAFIIQSEIWNLWMFSEAEDLNLLMRQGADALSERDFALAMDSFNAFVVLAPDRAEGWNKRATAYFMMGNFKASIEDVQRTLALEPRHFGALAGLGMIYDALKQKKAALRAFQAALDVNPHMAEIKERAASITQSLEDSKI
jgi:tetratricopeptide (TPR) repeat protein